VEHPYVEVLRSAKDALLWMAEFGWSACNP